MTNQEAIQMLTAKVKCMQRETSGTDVDCNSRNCDDCELCYAQGTTGEQGKALNMAISALQAQDVPDINVGNCPYCHEDSDGYVTPLEKNCHAFVRRSPIDGWVLSVKYGAWRKDIPIRFCPICGRELKHE